DRVGEGRDAIGRGGVEDGVVFGRDRARVDTGQTLVEPAQIAAQAAAGEELVTVLVTVQHLLIALGEGLELHRGAITGGPLFGVEGAHDRYATPAGQPALGSVGVPTGLVLVTAAHGDSLVVAFKHRPAPRRTRPVLSCHHDTRAGSAGPTHVPLPAHGYGTRTSSACTSSITTTSKCPASHSCSLRRMVREPERLAMFSRPATGQTRPEVPAKSTRSARWTIFEARFMPQGCSPNSTMSGLVRKLPVGDLGGPPPSSGS